jgi:hypothetical protein
MTWRTWLLAFLLFPMGAGCSGTSGGPVDGRVIDEETGQGVPGAYVMVRWTGSLGAGSIGGSPQQVCYHIEVARADGAGRYHIPHWTATDENRPAYATALNFHTHDFLLVSGYAPGFQESRAHRSTAVDMILRKLSGDFAARRLADMQILAGWKECAFSRSDAEKMKPMWKAIAEEELSLATAPKERKDAVERMFEVDFVLDSRELGASEAVRRLDERLSRALGPSNEGKR